MLCEALIMKRLRQHLNGKRVARFQIALSFRFKKIQLFNCKLNRYRKRNIWARRKFSPAFRSNYLPQAPGNNRCNRGYLRGYGFSWILFLTSNLIKMSIKPAVKISNFKHILSLPEKKCIFAHQFKT